MSLFEAVHAVTFSIQCSTMERSLRWRAADGHLCVVRIGVPEQATSLDDLQQLSCVEEKEKWAEDGALRHAADNSTV